jgi:large subunit ribosomal protein L10
MTAHLKQHLVDEISGRLESAQGVYLTDFSGLNVKSMTELRSRLRNAGIDYIVVKNTLAQRAMSGLDLPDVSEFFTGPTGMVIGREDAVTAAKILEEFAREHDNRPTVKVGIVERRSVSASEVGRIAKLPPREQLLAELAGAMQAPMAQLVFMMQGLLGEFVGLLEALRAERERA